MLLSDCRAPKAFSFSSRELCFFITEGRPEGPLETIESVRQPRDRAMRRHQLADREAISRTGGQADRRRLPRRRPYCARYTVQLGLPPTKTRSWRSAFDWSHPRQLRRG